MIQRVDLRSLDPMRLLTHESLFPEKEEEEEEEQQEEEEKDERLLNIWKTLLTEIEGQASGRKIILKRSALLQELSRCLNSATWQERIREKLFLSQHGPKARETEGSYLVRNLEHLNKEIDRANQVWFRKIPLVSRIFSIIDRIRIPRDE